MIRSRVPRAGKLAAKLLMLSVASNCSRHKPLQSLSHYRRGDRGQKQTIRFQKSKTCSQVRPHFQWIHYTYAVHGRDLQHRHVFRPTRRRHRQLIQSCRSSFPQSMLVESPTEVVKELYVSFRLLSCCWVFVVNLRSTFRDCMKDWREDLHQVWYPDQRKSILQRKEHPSSPRSSTNLTALATNTVLQAG